MCCAKANQKHEYRPDEQDERELHKTDGVVIDDTADDRTEYVVLHLVDGRSWCKAPLSHDIELHDKCENSYSKFCSN